MPQIFQVLRCYKCFVFQVHQTKKSNKWECKLCGEKQSVKRHYGIGTAKDCRLHVQKLNAMRGDIDYKKTTVNIDSEDEDVSEPDLSCSPIAQSSCKPITNSKWCNFLDEPETVEEPVSDNMKLGGAEAVLEIPKKQRKAVKRQFSNSNNKDYENHKELSPPPKIVPFSSTSTKLNTLPLTSNSENLVSQIDSKSNAKPIVKKKFIPPVVNKNSKWAQFTEDTEESLDTDCTNTSQSNMSHTRMSQNNAMFSLYDDTDLDNLLNI